MVNYDLEESTMANNGGYLECGSLNYGSYMQNNWAQSIAETTMPLKQSKLASLSGGNGANGAAGAMGSFQASIECRSREISKKLIIVNLISLLVNLVLALVAFYFSFVNNSPSTQAFAADCVLDFISSGIVLWRYYGDLNSVYMQAREQIACIYLGALFEISALAIIIKASSDMASGPGDELAATIGYDLVYLAAVATVACIILTMFKCSLYKTTRDNSILLDVINTLISSVFAMSIIMSQALININPSFWYLDPILSIVLALFMACFGAKVIHQNFNILRPVYRSTATNSNNNNGDCSPLIGAGKSNDFSSFYGSHRVVAPPVGSLNAMAMRPSESNYSANLNSSIDCSRASRNWQKTDYSTISFV